MTEHMLSRRAVMTGAAVCGLAGALAACSAGAPPAPSPSPSPPANPDSLLIAAKDVPVGGGVVVDGLVLVVQPVSGDFKAFDPRCPHMGAMVGVPNADGELTCPLHKARFQAKDGTRISGPATKGLTPIGIEVVDGQVRLI